MTFRIKYDILDKDGKITGATDSLLINPLRDALQGLGVKTYPDQEFPVHYPELMITVKEIY